MKSSASTTVVVGLGNILLGDDGVGVYAVRRFQEEMPEVPAFDIGTAIIHNEYLFEDAEFVIVFDAVDHGGAPGAVCVTTLAEIDDDGSQTSPHGITLASMFRGRRTAAPETVIVGVQPGTLEFGAPLTGAVAAAIPLMVATAREIISRSEETRDARNDASGRMATSDSASPIPTLRLPEHS